MPWKVRCGTLFDIMNRFQENPQKESFFLGFQEKVELLKDWCKSNNLEPH